MTPSAFAKADIGQVLDALTTDEAILLTAGVGFWYTHQIERLGIPAIKVSDGPNGIRGNHFFMSTPAKCLPCSTAMGATWDLELIQEVGLKLIAEEAKLRAASLVLAPTCNIQRNPLGGRSFESFSEDPHLSGMITAAYVRGVQSGGIGTTIKHFVNDRLGYDSIISPRALREIYLMPFMLAQKYASPWAYMTAYNRLNGLHVCENPFFLDQILRKEWKFDGMIMSDWFGTYSVSDGYNAGMDLEMPGINKWRTLDYVNRSIQSRKMTVKTVKKRARRVLELVKKCAEGAPEVLDGDGGERTVDTDETNELLRKVAAESIVLLKNDTGLLPVKPDTLEGKKVAIVGPNAKAFVLSGGGSAALKPSFFVSPYDGLAKVLAENGANLVYSEGAKATKKTPSLDYDMFTTSGERGWVGSWHAHENDDSMVVLDTVLEERLIDETRIFISTSTPKGITKRWTLKLRGQLKPREKDVEFQFGLTVAGRAKLFVDGNLVIDNWARQRRGDDFFGVATVEETGVYHLKAGLKHDILVEFCNVRGPADGDEDEAVMDSNPGVRLGGMEVADPTALLNEAVQLAKGSDLVIAVVGLNADWETEGYDRTTLSLPGRTDELIYKLAEVNQNVVVVAQAGSAITMPWSGVIHSLLHTWYLGNASGDAIADVIFGKHNPSGKLSLTFPKREEDIPSYGSFFNSEEGKIRYSEDVYVGYKHYHQRNIEPLFPFGFGLSYTTFTLSNLRISKPQLSVLGKDSNVVVSLSITNSGTIKGSEVVELFITIPSSSQVTHPSLQLKGFAKVRDLAPGQTSQVEIKLDKYAISYWSETEAVWVVASGRYGVLVVSGSDVMHLRDEQEKALKSNFEIVSGFEWVGL
ncbi:glycoside hydrolase family 3 protein [Crepidotus variabilis]|uniref:beta-glucosidase n=1 Tax=Crepidotus variabilis TaxID=179855 RepID=A0A9P6JJE1_9AGAR|nr:glycoside hydrolase family 3 protein [Crepidotus variabilis]